MCRGQTGLCTLSYRPVNNLRRTAVLGSNVLGDILPASRWILLSDGVGAILPQLTALNSSGATLVVSFNPAAALMLARL